MNTETHVLGYRPRHAGQCLHALERIHVYTQTRPRRLCQDFVCSVPLSKYSEIHTGSFAVFIHYLDQSSETPDQISQK